ncbi:MAG: carbonic anhydrase [Bacteroidales bacterium]
MPEPSTPLHSAADALERLQEGNERFRAGTSHLDRCHADMLAHLVHGQRPYATILCCSDSRVVPEIIFDAALGELFVVRVAGNVLSAEVAGSLQYAGAHLGTPLFVIMGHEGCGAVQATLDTMVRGTEQHSRIQALVDSIMPGLGGLDVWLSHDELLSQAVEANVRWTLQQIEQAPEAAAARTAGRMIVGAVYDLETGRVRILA